MTSVERVGRILRRQPADRLAVYENLWQETVALWTEEGHLKPGEHPSDHFDFDIERYAPFNLTANLPVQVVEETEDWVCSRDGNGALLRRFKHKNGGLEHVDFLVRNRAGWQETIAARLDSQRDRIDWEGYRAALRHARSRERFFLLVSGAVFEPAVGVLGHEHLLYGMAADPQWVADVFMTYAGLVIRLFEALFDEAGPPDGVYFPEDMGYKHKPFLSPAMYRELVMPAHKKLFAFLHGHGIPVILHSCGYVEPLVPGFIEAGIDCLQPMEVRAGMDPVKLWHDFGGRISFMGGMNVSTLATNDRAQIAAEMDRVLSVMAPSGSYILQSDHSIPPTVRYDTYRFFLERGRAAGI